MYQRDKLTHDMGYEQVAKRIANILLDPKQVSHVFRLWKAIRVQGSDYEQAMK